MNQNEVITAIVALMVCGLLAGVTAIPLIAGISQETITEEYNDESNAGWLRMAYDNKPFDVEITADGGNISAGGQTGTADSIVYADDKLSVYATADGLTIINGYATTPVVVEATNVQITNADGAISVTADGENVVNADSPAWAYYPDASGKYAYFDASNEGIKIKDGITPAYVGNFAGVWAYNGTVVAPDNLGDLGFSLNAVVEDDVITSVTWGIDSTVVVPSLSAPVDGDTNWTFEIQNGRAKITGYNGTNATKLVIPKTVSDGTNTYNVLWIGGTSNSSSPIISDSQISDEGATLFIENGASQITTYAFENVTKIKGSVFLPSSINSISGGSSSAHSFRNFGQSDTLIIEGTVNLGYGALINSSFKNLIVFGEVQSSIGSGLISHIKEVLNLGTAELTPTSFGLNADEVRDDVPASGYVAPLSSSVVVQKTGVVFDIIGLLPLIMILGVVMAGVYMIGRRYA